MYKLQTPYLLELLTFRYKIASERITHNFYRLKQFFATRGNPLLIGDKARRSIVHLQMAYK